MNPAKTRAPIASQGGTIDICPIPSMPSDSRYRCPIQSTRRPNSVPRYNSNDPADDPQQYCVRSEHAAHFAVGRAQRFEHPDLARAFVDRHHHGIGDTQGSYQQRQTSHRPEQGLQDRQDTVGKFKDSAQRLRFAGSCFRQSQERLAPPADQWLALPACRSHPCVTCLVARTTRL